MFVFSQERKLACSKLDNMIQYMYMYMYIDTIAINAVYVAIRKLSMQFFESYMEIQSV